MLKQPEISPDQISQYFQAAREKLEGLGRAGVNEVAKRASVQPTTVYRFRDGDDTYQSHAENIAKVAMQLTPQELHDYRRYRKRRKE
ncbi:hypothetical protein [Deinococcus cellulosilyticus]|uniref:Uncharacterized protein n=1 Tax=Deinococcus cellulosilyticus (strain DSM 18568 / NBRC 106333 / KACC 11606 / 5516J-15) TaxID=1223518 RepID=A0A511N7A9_DEIC1|nr:hypothetical protein [Deinococcus cellulosilyticus]GEM48733.1 hypothetical protein DC3_43680 [Deinococcus cellulosilyticus NBRC 106333 = KACC 11606]